MSRTRIVPTTSAVRRHLRNIGLCRREQARHLDASPCAILKVKVLP